MNESARIALQERIDATRSSEDRNRDGQFATPYRLAADIARLVQRTWPKKKPVRFLEPCVGTGAFFSAAKDTFPAFEQAVGIEKDPEFAAAAEKLWAASGLRVVRGDFTRQVASERFNLVLTNPPYVRHHHLTGDDKKRLGALTAQHTSLKLSGLAGLYCYFMLLSDPWLEDGAVSAWLVPSEFMDVNYGKEVKEYLTTRVRLRRIHRFCPTDGQFAEALVSSAVVVFEKASPAESVTFSFGGSVLKPGHEIEVPLETLKKAAKWTRFNDPKHDHVAVRATGPVFGDLFSIKRGLATGNNDFFILTRERAKELGLPKQYLRPILPAPRNLKTDVVEDDPDFVIIDCPLQPAEVEKRFPRFWAYLETGMKQKVNEGYLASRRSPWYSQESRPAAPFLCTYMGRSRNGKKPFRFIWNKSQATAHNVYLLLYPKGELRSALTRKPALAAKLFAALNAFDTKSFVGEGRVYGGGLFKMEPKELANIPAAFLTTLTGFSSPGLFDSVA